jgi:hypothetical protein
MHYLKSDLGKTWVPSHPLSISSAMERGGSLTPLLQISQITVKNLLCFFRVGYKPDILLWFASFLQMGNMTDSF